VDAHRFSKEREAMSGRFAKLEVQQERRTQAPEPEPLLGTPVRTPQHDLSLATEAWQSGRFEHALQMYTRALRGDRSLIIAWVGQVQMLVELAEYPEARLWADKALELFKTNGDLLAARAQAGLRQGDASRAVVDSDLSLQSTGSSALRWRVRAEVLLRSAAERARDCFEKSLAEPGADWFDRVLIARVYLFHRMASPALQYAQVGVDMQPGHPYAWLILGHAQAALGMRERAVLSYTHCAQLPGGQADADAALRALNDIGGARGLWRRLGGLFSR
jgi:tetratricopeptide (TPR) repeat protein